MNVTSHKEHSAKEKNRENDVILPFLAAVLGFLPAWVYLLFKKVVHLMPFGRGRVAPSSSMGSYLLKTGPESETATWGQSNTFHPNQT